MESSSDHGEEANSSPRQGANDEDDEDGVAQRDNDHRFSRYTDVIGEGRFKVVYRGFDEDDGQDIAWGVISADQQHLDPATMEKLLLETQRNTRLKHKNIIRCYKCWSSPGQINLITELFTSGNLREFIQEHQQLGADALRKFSRQILEGIEYLHTQQPQIVHGDLRCDKIYVNGNEGTVKIGDLGLVTLLSRLYTDWEPAGPRDGPPPDTEAASQSPKYDVLAFGMCMLEMYTRHCIDPHASRDTAVLLAAVHDDWARSILNLCFQPPESRPSATALLDRFFSHNRPKASPSRAATPPPVPDAQQPPRDLTSRSAMRELSEQLQAQPDAQPAPARGAVAAQGSLGHSSAAAASDVSGPPSDGEAQAQPLPRVKTCQLKGEDYVFTVRQSQRRNTAVVAYVQLTMTTVEDDSQPSASRTMEFEHHKDVDTPEGVGEEMQEEFNISDTDRELVIAVIREGPTGSDPCASSPRWLLRTTCHRPCLANYS